MKKTFLAIAFLLSVGFCSAQFYKSVLPSPGFSDSLSKTILDFRHNFKYIQGNQLPDRDDAEAYRSKVGLPGAVHTVIYRYHSVEDSTASWQAIMYDGGNYDAAVTAYRNTFRLVKKSRLHWFDNGSVLFTGEMEEPKEGVSFAESTLRLDITDPRYRLFAATVELISISDVEWEVQLNLESKQNDTEQE